MVGTQRDKYPSTQVPLHTHNKEKKCVLLIGTALVGIIKRVSGDNEHGAAALYSQQQAYVTYLLTYLLTYMLTYLHTNLNS